MSHTCCITPPFLSPLPLPNRLDPVLREAKAKGLSEAAIEARRRELMPAYQAMALRFADMHDTPQRM